MPKLTIVAGPNGAGKSTSAPALLSPGTPYVNADEIAKMLPGPGKDVQASRILLETWDTFAGQGASFAIETTLASRTLAPRVKALKEAGYEFVLYFFWLPDVELCIARVAERVRRGGHDIPEETIRRRYAAGVKNFFELYQPLADEWRFYDNINPPARVKIASGRYTKTDSVILPGTWDRIRKDYEKMADDRIQEERASYAAYDDIDRRLAAAIRAAILDHKLHNNPICTMRDGKVVWIQPEDIVIDEDE